MGEIMVRQPPQAERREKRGDEARKEKGFPSQSRSPRICLFRPEGEQFPSAGSLRPTAFAADSLGELVGRVKPALPGGGRERGYLCMKLWTDRF